MQFNGCRATLIPNLETMTTSNNLSKLVTIRNQHFWGIWKVLKRFLHVINCNLNSFSVSNFLFCLCWFTFCFICVDSFCYVCVDSHFVSFVLIHILFHLLIHILLHLCWFTFCFICVDSHFVSFVLIHIFWLFVIIFV